ncbi:ATP-binding protein [Kitasatospora sp. NPDC094028]
MLTEQLPVPQPVVVGLLCKAVAAGLPRRHALAGVLNDFCERREFSLAEVIADDGAKPDVLLIRIKERADLYAVVLPTIAHLGSRADADRRLRYLADAGIRLLVVRGPQDRFPTPERVRQPMEPGSRTVTMRFAADRASIGSVRRWAQRALPELGLGAEESDDLAGDVKVVLSELATNAVVHGCGDGRAGLVLGAALGIGAGGALRVCVSDPGPGLPELRAADGEAVGGRGLTLVLALTERFGVDSLAGGGKSVWAEFDLTAPARAVVTGLHADAPLPVAASRASRRRPVVSAPQGGPAALERIPAA